MKRTLLSAIAILSVFFGQAYLAAPPAFAGDAMQNGDAMKKGDAMQGDAMKKKGTAMKKKGAAMKKKGAAMKKG